MAGIDSHDIFSLVVKLVSIRIVLALVALLDLELEQIDVKINFLHGVTERNSYGLGYHNRHLDTRNQSFPICNRN